MTTPRQRTDSPILPPHRRLAAVVSALISGGLGVRPLAV